VTQYYPWLVFLHLVGVVLFSVSHGVSIATAFSIRTQREPSLVASHLATSQRAVRVMYVALLLLAVGGLGAAWAGGLLLAPWVIGSYVVLVIVLVVMYSVATPYYLRLRAAVASEPDALPALLDSRRPDALAAVGGIGLVVLVWLMVLKPG
jgi:hypothetical protein